MTDQFTPGNGTIPELKPQYGAMIIPGILGYMAGKSLGDALFPSEKYPGFLETYYQQCDDSQPLDYYPVYEQQPQKPPLGLRLYWWFDMLKWWIPILAVAWWIFH